MLFSVADDMAAATERTGGVELLRHRVLATAFYEPSTRTSCSFAAAMQRAGGTVISIDSVCVCAGVCVCVCVCACVVM